MVTVNINKREIIGGGGVLLLLLVFGIIYAYNPSGSGGNPSAMGHSADEIHVNVNGQLMNLQSAINALMATNPGGISQRIVIENSSCISDSGSNIYTLTAKCPAGYKLISCSHSEGDMRESNEGFQTIVDIENNQCIINVRKPGCESKEGETEKQRVTAVCFK